MIAVPMEAAIWRIVLLTAVPCAIKSAGKAFIPAVVTGMVTMVIPNIRTVYNTVTNKIGESAVKVINGMYVSSFSRFQ
jgi:hypothetical protein